MEDVVTNKSKNHFDKKGKPEAFKNNRNVRVEASVKPTTKFAKAADLVPKGAAVGAMAPKKELPAQARCEPTPEGAQPVENGGSAGAASEVVVTMTMPGLAKPTPGNPVPPAAATSELSSTTYGTQNGTTVVVGENATARADAPATVGPLADCAHDLRTIRRVRVDTVLIGNGHRACNPEQVRMIADSLAQVGLINPVTVTTAQI